MDPSLRLHSPAFRCTFADIDGLLQEDLVYVLKQMDLTNISQATRLPPLSLVGAVLDFGKLKNPQKNALICEVTEATQDPDPDRNMLHLFFHFYFVVNCDVTHCSLLQNKKALDAFNNIKSGEPVYIQFIHEEKCQVLKLKIEEQRVKFHFSSRNHSKEAIDTFLLQCMHALKSRGLQIAGAGTVVQSEEYFRWLADQATLLEKANILVHHECNTLWPFSFPYFVVAPSITKLHRVFERNTLPLELVAEIYKKRDIITTSDDKNSNESKEIKKKISEYKKKKKKLKKYAILQPAIEKMMQGKQI